MINTIKERLEQMGADMKRLEQEEQILSAAVMGHWVQALAQIKTLGRPMDLDAAGLCLEYALQSASPAVFDRLLDMLPKGEAAGTVTVRQLSRRFIAEVEGTLVTLAAVQGKTAQLKSLLAHGWDVNSASPDAAMALKKRSRKMDPFYRSAAERYESHAARYESQLRMMPDKTDGQFYPVYFQNMYGGITPLAAAIICGKTECVCILLDHGAWKEESPSVTRALMLRGREDDEDYQTCRKLVLTYGNAPRPMALWAVARSAHPEQLEEELCRCPYSEAAIAKAVWELTASIRLMPSRGGWIEEYKRDLDRLKTLERHYPQVLRRADMVPLLLRWATIWNGEEENLNFALSLCPKEVDLSLIREGLVRMPARKANAFLHRLCEGRRCVMDRDSVPPNTPVLVLQTLLRYVEFRPAASERSVSGLSYAILHTGNLRLIRKALMTGAIAPEESRELLLRCQSCMPWATTTRTLLLTTPRPAGERGKGEYAKKLGYGPMFRWIPPEVQELDYNLLLEDCNVEVERELVQRGLYDYRCKVDYETAEGKWEVDSLLTLLCWYGRSRAVERWVCLGPKEELQLPRIIRPAGAPFTLKATPLCTAAFAGEREMVETLLRLGAEAEEQVLGVPSVLECENTFYPITPLLAAMVRGHWEVARLLVDHGATCDVEQQAVKQLWAVFQKEDLHQAVQVQLNR